MPLLKLCRLHPPALLLLPRDIKEEGVAFVVHGAVCCLYYVSAFMVRRFSGFGAMFVLWECSTPFVHLRFFLYQLGMEKSQLYMYNGIAMYIVFFLCRIVWGYYTSLAYVVGAYQLLNHRYPHGEVPLPLLYPYFALAIVSNCLNTYWFFLMSKKIVRYLGSVSHTHKA